MARTKLDMMALPRIVYALRLSIASMGMVLNQVGHEFQRGIRQHTPRGSGKLFYKCKVISHNATPWTGRVKVGWQRKDFARKKFYAVFIGEGTGIRGGKIGSLIRPTKSKAKVPMIRYQYKGKWVSMKSTKGIKPRKMLEKGYKEAMPAVSIMLLRTFYHSMQVYKNA